MATLEELRLNTVVCKQIAGKRVSIAEVDGKVFAFEDTCPHQGESLSKGRLNGDIITCPAHNWKFNIKTGESPVIPDEFIYTFRVETEPDGRIFVVM